MVILFKAWSIKQHRVCRKISEKVGLTDEETDRQINRQTNNNFLNDLKIVRITFKTPENTFKFLVDGQVRLKMNGVTEFDNQLYDL